MSRKFLLVGYHHSVLYFIGAFGDAQYDQYVIQTKQENHPSPTPHFCSEPPFEEQKSQADIRSCKNMCFVDKTIHMISRGYTYYIYNIYIYYILYIYIMYIYISSSKLTQTSNITHSFGQIIELQSVTCHAQCASQRLGGGDQIFHPRFSSARGKWSYTGAEAILSF